MRAMAVCLMALLCLLVSPLPPAEGEPTDLLLNGSFEFGRAKPDHWESFGLTERRWDFGGVDGEGCVSLSGNGREVGWWYARRWVRVDYNKLYHLAFAVRSDGNARPASVTAGLNLVTQQVPVGKEWQRREFVFRSPDYLANVQFRLGQSKVEGTVSFDDVSLRPAVAVHRSRGLGRFSLGDGESIVDRRYTAVHALAGPNASDCRFLEHYTAEFQQDRWVLDKMDEVLYHHEVARFGIPLLEQRLTIPPETKYGVGFKYPLDITEEEPDVARSLPQEGVVIEMEVPHCQGVPGVQVSSSWKGPWVQIAAATKPGLIKVAVPRYMLPRRDIWVRIKSLAGSRIEVKGYRYQAMVIQKEWRGPVLGQSRYLAVVSRSPDLRFDLRDVGELIAGGRSEVSLVLVNQGARRKLAVAVLIQKGSELVSRPEEVFFLAPRGVHLVALPYAVRESGEHLLKITCRDADTDDLLLMLEGPFTVPVSP